MKSLKESILNPDNLDDGVKVTMAMDKINNLFFKRRCEYELKNHVMYLNSYGVMPRLSNNFLKIMHELDVDKIIWNSGGCKSKIYDDWDIDFEINKGAVSICCDSISGELKCDDIYIEESVIFKNATIYSDNIEVNYGVLPTFKGNSRIYAKTIMISGGPYVDYKQVRDNLFINELEQSGLISINEWGQISRQFDKNTDLTLKKICGKIFPDIKEIIMTQIHRTGIYIGKKFNMMDWGHDWQELKLKDGNSLWIGEQN